MARDLVSSKRAGNHRDQSKTIEISVFNRAGALTSASDLTAEVLSPADPDNPTTYTYGVDGDWENPATGEYTFTFTPDIGSDVWPWEVRITATTADDSRVGHAKIWVEKDRFQDAE